MQLTQGQSLLTILTLVYLSDCFYWCRLSGLVLSASRFTNWKILRPHQLLSNRKSALILLPTLPPLGWSHLIAPPPFLLSPNGISFTQKTNLSDPTPLADLKNLKAHGTELKLNGKKITDAPNKKTANQWIAQLHPLATSQDPNTDIRHIIKNQFNLKEIATTQLNLYRTIKTLRIANIILLLIMFIYIPFMSCLFGLNATLLPNIALLFITALTNAILYYRAHAKTNPTEKSERITQLLLQLISWPMATRSADHITRNTFAAYHPLAVASVILPPQDTQTLTADHYRKLKYPTHPHDAPNAHQRNHHTATLIDIINETLLTRGWDPNAALQPPPNPNQDHSYCPRCHQTYTLTQGTCASCPPIALLPLPTTKENK